jgi:uncharacterized delta-60 repeat protein
MSSGALDPTFGTNGTQTVSFSGFSDQEATAVAVQPDGKIIVVGSIEVPGTTNHDFAIVRLKSNGSLDTSFGTNGEQIISFDSISGYANDVASAVVLQPDGKIVVAGSAQDRPIDQSGYSDFAVARLNANGSLDTSFGVWHNGLQCFTDGIGIHVSANAVALDGNGNIVLAGDFFIHGSEGPTQQALAIIRLNPDGTLDRTFGNNSHSAPTLKHT